MDEDPKVCGTERGDNTTAEGESSAEVPKKHTPVKKGRGRPQGSKKLKVSVTDVNLTPLESGITNGSIKIPRGRGRPSLPKPPPEATPVEESVVARKRGRPRKSAPEGLPNGGTSPPQGPVKCDGGEEAAAVVKNKRGRPKGSLNKKPRLQRESSQLRSTRMNGIKRRGRPRKSQAPPPPPPPPPSQDGAQVKRGRGRPKAAPSRKRGRPRKNPLAAPVDRSKPKVWKPLGRPRKYPRVEPPEGAAAAVVAAAAAAGPRRSRGRPRKSESKKGAHLRKSPLADGNAAAEEKKTAQRGEDGAPRKRGRPKGSLNKNKARGKTAADRKKAAPKEEEEDEEEEEEVKGDDDSAELMDQDENCDQV